MEYLTGFWMGAFFGVFIELIIVAICNLFCTWFGWLQLNIIWWMMVPLPLMFGLIIGKSIVRLHLGDY
jgi:hypothetical protein